MTNADYAAAIINHIRCEIRELRDDLQRDYGITVTIEKPVKYSRQCNGIELVSPFEAIDYQGNVCMASSDLRKDVPPYDYYIGHYCGAHGP